MCGIVGIANSGSRGVNREVLESMNRAITHRGPDEDGFFIKDNIGLAIRRLSIIDLATGSQPISNADSTLTIVFNGEIYNYQELKKDLERDGVVFKTNSDTETILHLYEKHGKDCLQYLRGMFAIAIWDDVEKELFLARDRVGKKPLLYSRQDSGDLIFGSEFQSILEHPAVSREVDHLAIDSYLSFLAIPAPMTAFKAIRKLEPGHWLKWKEGHVETHRYWQPDFSKKVKISQVEAEQETERLLREATKLRLISEVPLGAFLSGGVDSSMIVALMAQESDKPVKTFSIGFEEQDFSELKYARKVAAHVGAEYNEFIVKADAVSILPTLVEHYGEPFADSSAIPTYYVSRETRKFVTVALNGDGGDESFAGYERHAAMRFAEFYGRIPQVARTLGLETPIKFLPASKTKKSRVRDVRRFAEAASLPAVERYFRWISTFDRTEKDALYSENLKNEIDDNDPSREIAGWVGQSNGNGILDKVLLTDLMTYLPTDLLVKVDIASMANSLEARSPFLDHKLIEFAASLPESIKMKRFETKTLLKRVAAKLVPKEVIYRRKMGFGVPIGKWIREDMRDYVTEILESDAFAKRGLFNKASITKYLREHVSGERDHSSRIWSLLMLELWYQRFID